jgi:serine protease Do
MRDARHWHRVGGVVLLSLWVVLLVTVPALAQGSPAADAPPAPEASTGMPKAAIGFSNLVLRLDATDEIGIDSGDYRVHILEAMRRVGFNAVGAESLVFGKDRAAAADFVLGGTVRAIRCKAVEGSLNCSVSIHWELLDARSDDVVYEVTTSGRARGLRAKNPKSGRRLVLLALQSLVNRPRFRAVLESRFAPEGSSNGFAPRRYLRCAAPDRSMPGDSERVLQGTAVVHSGSAMGSAFFVSPSGLLLTAAHVMVSPDAEVRLRDGTVHKARLLRMASGVDAALLHVPDLAPTACLQPSPPPHTLGTEVYAIGTPASEELAFSLTRGIISGARRIDGKDLLQTDASINPGNSGGPLIDGKGRAVAIVSWKVGGRGVEGLAFGVPVETALRALRLVASSETTPSLLSESGDAAAKTADKIVDSPDPWPSLEPEGDRQADPTFVEDDYVPAEPQTPLYVPVLRWGGLGLACLGTVGLITTEGSSSTLSWTALLVGGAAFVASWPLEPSGKAQSNDDRDPKPADTWATLRVRGPAVQVEVVF